MGGQINSLLSCIRGKKAASTTFLVSIKGALCGINWPAGSVTTKSRPHVVASQFDDKPEGGGDRAAQQSPPKMPKDRCRLIKLVGSFSPLMSKHNCRPACR